MSVLIYSAFAYACPLQIDTFLFVIIHRHRIQTLSKHVSIVLLKIGPLNTTYGVPSQGHLQGQTRDNSNTRSFHTKTEYIYIYIYMLAQSPAQLYRSKFEFRL